MINIFSSIPIRDPYKVAHPESVVLLARPSIIRICVIVEALVVAVVFVLSFYYTQYDSSTETKITFEALKPPYECSILAPRKDIEDLSPHTSELVAFSSPRYSYEECLIALGGEGLNVCADGNHNDFVLSVFGITSNDDNCEEIFLSDNYRFCLGRENSLEFENGYSTSFLNRDDFDYTPVYGVETYYFVNSNGKISPSTAEFSSIVSDFVVGNNNDIYVLVVDSKNVPAVHRFQQGRQSSDLVLTLSLSISHIYGLAYGSDSVFVLSINDGSKGGSIFKFNTTSGVKTTVNTVVNCSSVFQSNLDLGGEGARYISYGADGNLYVMCTRSTTNNIKRGAVTKPLFPFYQVDPVTLTLRNTFYAPISQLSDVETGSSLASVSQVLNRGSKILFLAGAPLSSLVVGSLQQQAQGELQNLVATGPYFGEYAVVYDTDRVYFAGGVTSERQVYSIASNAFTYEARNFIGEFYFPTRIELGLMYQICSDNITDYQLDASLSTSFYKLCAKSNGLYYQSNQFFSVPINCQESISNPSAVDSLVACPSMATIYNAFVSSVCEDSFEKVCKAAYTDNPPFSCSKTVYPTWITCLATAFANASGVLAVTFVIIKVLLRQIQYHYVHEFEYDRKKERYHDLDHRRIHASLDEYIAGLEEGRMVVSDKVAFQFRKKNRNVLDNSNKEADRSLMGMADDSPKKDDDVDVITYPQAYDTVHSHNTNVDQVTKEHKQ